MHSENSLARQAATQWRTITALLMHELLTRYGRHNVGFAWLFLEPMLFTLGIVYLWSLSGVTRNASISIVSFAITGYSSVLIWRNAANRCNKAVQTNWALLFHRNVTPLDIFISRIFLEIAGATVSLVVLAVIFAAAGQVQPPADLLMTISAWILLSWFALGFALIVGALTERSDSFERMWHIGAYLLFPLSGAVFMVEWLPAEAQNIVLALPMVHGVEMLRHGWFGDAIVTYESPIFLILSNLLLTVAGLLLALSTPRAVEVSQ